MRPHRCHTRVRWGFATSTGRTCTLSIEHVRENLAALELELSDDDLAALSASR
jgi:aryl-alcohol dehydrogenase-like predicted oxidoreductase